MKLNMKSYKEDKIIHQTIIAEDQDIFAIPLPGATCTLAGATCTCTSCCF